MITSESSGNEQIITVEGRFDFSSHQAFRDAYEQIEHEPQTYVVDMNRTTYLDSSALGMLLLLRDHAGGDSSDVRIINANRDVENILRVANFDGLFQVNQ